MNTFLFSNAVRNIGRQRKRYAVFGILIFLAAVSSVFILSVVAPARMYAEDLRNRTAGIILTEEDEAQYNMTREANRLNSTFSLMQAGILVVSGVALGYVSSMVINERLFDAGVLCAIGLSKRQIFFSFLWEILVFCAAVIGTASVIGYTSAYVFLRSYVSTGRLGGEIMDYFGTGGVTFVIVAAVAFLLILLPVAQLSARIAKSSPAALLSERK